ncbi:cupredoxin domain-containing protein [Candidatus Woesearchaeota archaeon]|nr:MAG: hypothetical protein QS99_C0002G0182 [archaeon GW2011_AR4]MBS3129037.1 cupredoxin domain-containing protein [Candidatus Woesearchaeota archaeon]HIH37771.1 hypothetical protein [Candidatus Woesearchaeota archaeon]HIH49546.1 hypothetical protein [Candidatus Woesearchaeota archaeon]HIJ03896.1 hypothetical protein [Candidatus Woesearchaeota archaeon]
MFKEIKPLPVIGAIVIVLLVGIATMTTYTSAVKQKDVAQPLLKTAPAPNGMQEVTLSYSKYGYVMTPSTLQPGVPVRMTVDTNTVTGCMRSVTIPSFGVRKSVSPGDNIIEFIPDKSGTFQVVCSMGMGRGSFTVANGAGVIQAAPEPVITGQGGSCGASGGGCGCGG